MLGKNLEQKQSYKKIQKTKNISMNLFKKSMNLKKKLK